MKPHDPKRLNKLRKQLKDKAERETPKKICLKNLKRSVKAIRATENNATLSRYISDREIEKLTLKDFE
ncbi:hypothetical protein AAU57_12095 [Nonlabens sp. YIK11]|uniref:hypothetical protein n=1 Tax=Nonlabens sp. YIK11 TaxID=1453349 RepID=UPI0006DC58AA|nr:hypothetical protein [Nonlabens sp. YIK11]KQC33989.1 hypothetical protein AAU57_12095 [Nonlabens sp. YIK11]